MRRRSSRAHARRLRRACVPLAPLARRLQRSGVQAGCKAGASWSGNGSRIQERTSASPEDGPGVPSADAVPRPRASRGLRRERPDPARRTQAAARPRRPAASREPGRRRRAPDRRPVGRGTPGGGEGHAAGVRIAAQERRGHEPDRGKASRLPRPRGSSRARRPAVRVARAGGGAAVERPARDPRNALRGARAVAGPGALRPRRRTVAPGRHRAPRGDQVEGGGGADRGSARVRPPRGGRRRARVARGRSPAPRAALGVADARALSVRPARPRP